MCKGIPTLFACLRPNDIDHSCLACLVLGSSSYTSIICPFFRQTCCQTSTTIRLCLCLFTLTIFRCFRYGELLVCACVCLCHVFTSKYDCLPYYLALAYALSLSLSLSHNDISIDYCTNTTSTNCIMERLTHTHTSLRLYREQLKRIHSLSYIACTICLIRA